MQHGLVRNFRLEVTITLDMRAEQNLDGTESIMCKDLAGFHYQLSPREPETKMGKMLAKFIELKLASRAKQRRNK